MVAKSSVKVEYTFVALEIYVVSWLKKLLEELKTSTPLPIKVYYDNKLAIAIAHNLVLHT